MEKVDRALADARNTIDSYIAGRYTLPLSTVPQVLTRIACELARYYLYDDQITDTVKQRYDANIKFLVGVASGDVKLGVDAESGSSWPAAPAPSCTRPAAFGIAALREGFSDGSGHDPI